MNVKYVYSDYKIGIGYNEVSKNMYKNDNILPYAYHTNNLVNINDFNKIDYPYNIELLLKNAIVEKGNKKIETHVNKVNLDYKIINQNKDNIQIERNEEGIYINVVKDDKFTIKLSKPLNNSILFINLNGINKNSCSNGNTYITINNIKNLMTCSSWIYQNKNETFHYVISDEELEYFNIEIGKGKYIISSIDTYVLDYDYISNLNENITKFNITNMTDSKIEGTINVNEDGYFITSIPYDKSFIVKANGKNINIETVNTSFLGFKLDKGNYNIEITYKTPLLKEGEIISLISFILLIVLIYYDIKKENKMRF
jgi:uncharacterized membrane protein YfhO